jgi:hypothetical protein
VLILLKARSPNKVAQREEERDHVLDLCIQMLQPADVLRPQSIRDHEVASVLSSFLTKARYDVGNWIEYWIQEMNIQEVDVQNETVHIILRNFEAIWVVLCIAEVKRLSFKEISVHRSLHELLKSSSRWGFNELLLVRL